MSATNNSIIEKAIKDYREKIVNEVGKRCETYCEKILQEAISARENAAGAHDFTGNLLNSIVVCLYKQGAPMVAFFASDKVADAIQGKMTRPYRYYFRHDYRGVSSVYHGKDPAEVETDQGYGKNDAANFFRGYRPSPVHLFDIVVAYTTEYADFVEWDRGTTGILRTYDTAERLGGEMFGVHRTSGLYS